MTLGELIKALQRAKSIIVYDPSECYVRFDFGGLFPGQLDSWRGIYAELALGYTEWNYDKAWDKPTVENVLRRCEEAVGATYQGYKGGEYRMTEHSEVWIDNYGQCTHTAIDRITENSYEVMIHTRHEP